MAAAVRCWHCDGDFFRQEPAHPDAEKYQASSAGKGNALLLLAELLGVDRNATIAVGDSTNDCTMVETAGLGLAMDNAVPKLKAVADAVVCNNRDHVVKYILEHYIG